MTGIGGGDTGVRGRPSRWNQLRSDMVLAYYRNSALQQWRWMSSESDKMVDIGREDLVMC